MMSRLCQARHRTSAEAARMAGMFVARNSIPHDAL
jgi:hypothetical protein